MATLSPPVDQHPPVGQLGEQVVDGVVEAEPALLDQEQRSHGDDGLGHRGDPEDGIATHRLRFAPGQDAAGAGGDVGAAGGEPRHPSGIASLHMAGHHVAESGEPYTIESAHIPSDVSGEPDSSVSRGRPIMPR